MGGFLEWICLLWGNSKSCTLYQARHVQIVVSQLDREPSVNLSQRIVFDWLIKF